VVATRLIKRVTLLYTERGSCQHDGEAISFFSFHLLLLLCSTLTMGTIINFLENSSRMILGLSWCAKDADYAAASARERARITAPKRGRAARPCASAKILQEHI